MRHSFSQQKIHLIHDNKKWGDFWGGATVDLTTIDFQQFLREILSIGADIHVSKSNEEDCRLFSAWLVTQFDQLDVQLQISIFTHIFNGVLRYPVRSSYLRNSTGDTENVYFELLSNLLCTFVVKQESPHIISLFKSIRDSNSKSNDLHWSQILRLYTNLAFMFYENIAQIAEKYYQNLITLVEYSSRYKKNAHKDALFYIVSDELICFKYNLWPRTSMRNLPWVVQLLFDNPACLAIYQSRVSRLATPTRVSSLIDTIAEIGKLYTPRISQNSTSLERITILYFKHRLIPSFQELIKFSDAISFKRVIESLAMITRNSKYYQFNLEPSLLSTLIDSTVAKLNSFDNSKKLDLIDVLENVFCSDDLSNELKEIKFRILVSFLSLHDANLSDKFAKKQLEFISEISEDKVDKLNKLVNCDKIISHIEERCHLEIANIIIIANLVKLTGSNKDFHHLRAQTKLVHSTIAAKIYHFIFYEIIPYRFNHYSPNFINLLVDFVFIHCFTQCNMPLFSKIDEINIEHSMALLGNKKGKNLSHGVQVLNHINSYLDSQDYQRLKTSSLSMHTKEKLLRAMLGGELPPGASSIDDLATLVRRTVAKEWALDAFRTNCFSFFDSSTFVAININSELNAILLPIEGYYTSNSVPAQNISSSLNISFKYCHFSSYSFILRISLDNISRFVSCLNKAFPPSETINELEVYKLVLSIYFEELIYRNFRNSNEVKDNIEAYLKSRRFLFISAIVSIGYSSKIISHGFPFTKSLHNLLCILFGASNYSNTISSDENGCLSDLIMTSINSSNSGDKIHNAHLLGKLKDSIQSRPAEFMNYLVWLSATNNIERFLVPSALKLLSLKLLACPVSVVEKPSPLTEHDIAEFCSHFDTLQQRYSNPDESQKRAFQIIECIKQTGHQPNGASNNLDTLYLRRYRASIKFLQFATTLDNQSLATRLIALSELYQQCPVLWLNKIAEISKHDFVSASTSDNSLEIDLIEITSRLKESLLRYINDIASFVVRHSFHFTVYEKKIAEIKAKIGATFSNPALIAEISESYGNLSLESHAINLLSACCANPESFRDDHLSWLFNKDLRDKKINDTKNYNRNLRQNFQEKFIYSESGLTFDYTIVPKGNSVKYFLLKALERVATDNKELLISSIDEYNSILCSGIISFCDEAERIELSAVNNFFMDVSQSRVSLIFSTREKVTSGVWRLLFHFYLYLHGKNTVNSYSFYTITWFSCYCIEAFSDINRLIYFINFSLNLNDVIGFEDKIFSEYIDLANSLVLPRVIVELLNKINQDLLNPFPSSAIISLPEIEAIITAAKINKGVLIDRVRRIYFFQDDDGNIQLNIRGVLLILIELSLICFSEQNQYFSNILELSLADDERDTIFNHSPVIIQEDQLEFLIHPVKGDGNCFYSAVSRYTDLEVTQLRQMAAEGLAAQLNLSEQLTDSDFRIAVSSDLSCYDYYEAVKSGNLWAGDAEIIALSRQLNRAIIVIGPDGNVRNKVHLDDQSDFNHCIVVYYNDINHYDRLILSGDRLVTDDAASVEKLRKLCQGEPIQVKFSTRPDSSQFVHSLFAKRRRLNLTNDVGSTECEPASPSVS